MRFRNRIAPLSAVAIAMVFAGCAVIDSEPDGTITGGNVTEPGIGGVPQPGNYRASWVNTEPPHPTPSLPLIMAVVNQEGSGWFDAGCNIVTANFEPNSIAHGQLVDFGCPSESAQSILAESLAGDYLRLSEDSFQVGYLVFNLAHFELPPYPLPGAYDVILLPESRQIADANVTENGTVEFFAGCNRIGLDLATNNEVESIYSTDTLCDSVTETWDEGALLSNLNAGSEIQMLSENVFELDNLRFLARPDLNRVNATWRIDPESNLSPSDLEVDVLVTRIACNSGVTGFVNPPEFAEIEDSLYITFTVGPRTLGGAFCPSNNEVPYTIYLGGGLQHFSLVDGICKLPENLQTSFCRTPIRWEPDTGIVEMAW